MNSSVVPRISDRSRLPVLYITLVNPFHCHSGARQRTNLILKVLLKRYQVDVVCFADEERPGILPDNCEIKFWGGLSKISKTKRFFSLFLWGMQSVYYAPEAHNIVASLLKVTDYKFIIFRYMTTVGFCNLNPDKTMVVDVDDLPEQTFQFLAHISDYSWIRKCYFLLCGWKAKICTNIFLEKIHHSLFPNLSQCKFKGSYYLPNIPYPQKKSNVEIPVEQRKFIVLFVGMLGYLPNVLGLDFFINHIWMNVLKVVPTARLRIIGKNLQEKYQEQWKSITGVEIIGFVEKLEEEYLHARTVIAPIYIGSGTNIKVLEAMYMNRPCVISSFAARGFETYFEDGKNVFIANDEHDYAEKVIKILQDAELNSQMAKNGAEIIEKYYSFQVFESLFYKYLDQK